VPEKQATENLVPENQPAGARAPITVGVLYDFPQHDGGASVEEAIRIGISQQARGRLDREVELVARQAHGLPAGTIHDVERCFGELVSAGVLAIIGPAVSDNGLVVGKLAQSAGIPCVNYTGGEHTRSAWMFHYQVGSLEEEPLVLVGLLARDGHRTVALVYDKTPVGRGYAAAFTQGADSAGIEVVASAAVDPLADTAEALRPTVRRLRSTEPGAVAYLGMGVAARGLALALAEEGWSPTVVANSALMFAYLHREWRQTWQGWTYVDTLSDANRTLGELRDISPRTSRGPVGVAAYDIGRLLGEGLVRTTHLTREGLRDGLESVKRLRASSGLEGTTMGFGHYDHGALKGPFLVLRRWENGRSVELAEQLD
jgi:branched-chain amino acid transport system substrate-binding protein